MPRLFGVFPVSELVVAGLETLVKKVYKEKKMSQKNVLQKDWAKSWLLYIFVSGGDSVSSRKEMILNTIASLVGRGSYKTLNHIFEELCGFENLCSNKARFTLSCWFLKTTKGGIVDPIPQRQQFWLVLFGQACKEFGEREAITLLKPLQ